MLTTTHALSETSQSFVGLSAASGSRGKVIASRAGRTRSRTSTIYDFLRRALSYARSRRPPVLIQKIPANLCLRFSSSPIGQLRSIASTRFDLPAFRPTAFSRNRHLPLTSSHK
jgi:hypothetical protein